MAAPFFGNEIFRLEKDDPDITLPLLQEAVVDFFANTRASGEKVPIIAVENKAHDYGENVPSVGFVTNLRLVDSDKKTKLPTLYADGYLDDQFASIVNRGMYEKKSIAFYFDETGKIHIHHLAYLGLAGEAVKGLKPNQDSLLYSEKNMKIRYSQKVEGENIIPREGEKQKGAKKMDDKIIDYASVAEVKLLIKDAIEKEKIAIAAQFAEKENGFKKTIEMQGAELEDARKKLVEYSEKERQGKIDTLKRDVDSWQIEPADKDRVFSLLNALYAIGTPEAIAQYTANYKYYSSLKSPIINTGGSRGDSGSDELPDTIAIPSHEEAMRMKSGGAK